MMFNQGPRQPADRFLRRCEILPGYSGDLVSLIKAVNTTPGIAKILFLSIYIIAYFPSGECPGLETMHEHEQGNLGVQRQRGVSKQIFIQDLAVLFVIIPPSKLDIATAIERIVIRMVLF